MASGGRCRLGFLIRAAPRATWALRSLNFLGNDHRSVRARADDMVGGRDNFSSLYYRCRPPAVGAVTPVWRRPTRVPASLDQIRKIYGWANRLSDFYGQGTVLLHF